MTLSVELYWSFRSPYSYLATPRIVQLADEWDMEVRVRPVLPAAVRTPDFFKRIHPLWIPYLMRDTQRLAEMLGLPFRWPRPDPVVQDPETRAIAAEQPLARRLTRLGIAAADRGRGLAFIDRMSRLIFGAGIENWHQGPHMAEAAAAAGLSLDELERDIADVESYDRRIEEHQQAQLVAGHWGVPLLVFENEPFFGQDRIDVCLWRMRQRGLRPRR